MRILREVNWAKHQMDEEFSRHPDESAREKYWNLESFPERADPDFAGPIMARHQALARAVREAWSKNDGPLVPLDYSLGPGMHLLHLVPIRSSQWIMYVDLVWRMQHGDTSRLGSDLAGMVEFTSQLRDDRTIISSLVHAACFVSTSSLLREHAIAGGHVDQATASRMLALMDAQLGDDPFGMRAAFAGEHEYMGNWLADGITNPDRRKQVEDMLVGWSNVDPASADELGQLNDTEYEAQVHLYDAAMTQMQSALSIEDADFAQAELNRLNAEIIAGGFGLLAQISAPAMNRVHSSVVTSIELYEPLRQDLLALAASPDAAMKLRNAAIWYRRAFAARDALAGAEWAVVLGNHESDDAADDHDADDDESENVQPDITPADIIEHAQPIIAILMEAAEIERCIWQPRHPLGSSLFVYEPLGYHNWMPELARLHHFAAQHAFDEQNYETAASHVNAGIMMVNHMRQDGTARSAALAVDIFTIMLPQIERLSQLAGEHLDNEEIQHAHDQTAASLAGMRQDDPFGCVYALHNYAAFTTRGQAMSARNSKDSRGGFARQFQYQTTPPPELTTEERAALVSEVNAVPIYSFVATMKGLHTAIGRAAADLLDVHDLESLAAARATIEAAFAEDPSLTHIPLYRQVVLDDLLALAQLRITSDAIMRR